MIVASCRHSSSPAQMSAVRRSCQTMALWIGLPVARSQMTAVSRWLVMPMASGRCRASLRIFHHGTGHIDGGLPYGFWVMFDPAICREMLRKLGRPLGKDVAGLVKQDGARRGSALINGDDGSLVRHHRPWYCLCPYMFQLNLSWLQPLFATLAATLAFQILLPFLVRFQIGKMHIERCIGDLDFTGEQQHRYNQQMMEHRNMMLAMFGSSK